MPSIESRNDAFIGVRVGYVCFASALRAFIISNMRVCSWTPRYSVPHLDNPILYYLPQNDYPPQQTPYAILCPILDKPPTLFFAPSWTNPILYSLPQNGCPSLTIERYPFDVFSWRAELLGLIFLVETYLHVIAKLLFIIDQNSQRSSSTSTDD